MIGARPPQTLVHGQPTRPGQDIFKGDERIIVSDDGTAFKMEINFTGDPILDYLDAHHLLFTGEGYTPQRLYLAE